MVRSLLAQKTDRKNSQKRQNAEPRRSSRPSTAHPISPPPRLHPAHTRNMKTLLFTLTLTGGLLAQSPFQVKVTGHGRPMILIPGYSCPGEVWDEIVAHYQDRYQMHVLTLAGFAGVPRVPGPFLENAREAIAAYI